MNLNTLQWDKDMLDVFEIPIEVLPKIMNSTDYFGTILKGYLKGIPITGYVD
jgi:glycerol kinase